MCLSCQLNAEKTRNKNVPELNYLETTPTD